MPRTRRHRRHRRHVLLVVAAARARPKNGHGEERRGEEMESIWRWELVSGLRICDDEERASGGAGI
jgi:hypothetical protein